ncbi:hypothetical protein [Microcoleus asticus]|uniref:hypothetical protein n=1 Tax=Microcoleus asticus TaxID=2815231 RepID=UPI001553BAEF|nr:hypothetical protein [Microcoleus asticus]
MLIKIIGDGAIHMSETRRAIAFWHGKVDRTLCIFLNAEASALFGIIELFNNTNYLNTTAREI